MTTNTKSKIATHGISLAFNNRADMVAIALRREGFTAYVESSECGTKFYLVTDAPRSVILLAAGHGMFLDMI